MQEFVEFTLGGISDGVIYAAIGLSLVLIWRGTRVLNYAQGGMAMFTSYVALFVINATGNYWLGFVVALGAGLVLGAVLERAVVRPTMGKPPLNAVIVTIGLLILLEGVAGIIYGGQYRSFPPAVLDRRRSRSAASRSGRIVADDHLHRGAPCWPRRGCSRPAVPVHRRRPAAAGVGVQPRPSPGCSGVRVGRMLDTRLGAGRADRRAGRRCW